MFIAITIRYLSGRRFSEFNKAFLWTITLLALFGIVYPLFLGETDITKPATNGKDFLCFYFLSYLDINRDRILKKNILKPIISLGTLLSFVVIVFVTTGYFPPAYNPVNLESSIFEGIHIFSAMYIFLAITIITCQLTSDISMWKRSLVLITMFTALAFEGHRSVLYSALVTSFFYISLKFTFKRMAATFYFALFTMLLLFAFYGSPLTDEFVFNVLSDVSSNKGSIGSRLNYNYFRIEAFSDRPLLGYGFQHESSKTVKYYFKGEESRFTSALGTVDAGYIDLLVRFGVIGSFVFLFIFGYSLYKKWVSTDKSDIFTHAILIYLFSYFIISLTWSVFTYSHGIIPIALCFYLTSPYKTSGHSKRHPLL
jgi:O-antigen ligase